MAIFSQIRKNANLHAEFRASRRLLPQFYPQKKWISATFMHWRAASGCPVGLRTRFDAPGRRRRAGDAARQGVPHGGERPGRRRAAGVASEAGGRAAGAGSGSAVPAPELVDPAGGVHDLLRTGVERMALRAHVEVKLAAQGGARPERVPAATGHGEVAVLGMDVGFHVRTRTGPRSRGAESIPDPEIGSRPGLCRSARVAGTGTPSGRFLVVSPGRRRSGTRARG